MVRCGIQLIVHTTPEIAALIPKRTLTASTIVKDDGRRYAFVEKPALHFCSHQEHRTKSNCVGLTSHP